MLKLNEKEKEIFEKIKKSYYFRIFIFLFFFSTILDIYRFILEPYVFSIYRTDLEIAQRYEPNHRSFFFPFLKEGKRSGKKRVKGLHEIHEICYKINWKVEEVTEDESIIYYICNTKGRYIIDNFKNIYPSSDRNMINKFSDIIIEEYEYENLEFLNFIDDKIIVKFHIKNKKIINIENKNITNWKDGSSTLIIKDNNYNLHYIYFFKNNSYNPNYVGLKTFKNNMKNFYLHYEKKYKIRK